MFDTYTERFVLFVCVACGLESDINSQEYQGRTFCKSCYEEVIRMKAVGLSLSEELIKKMKDHVAEVKKYRLYSLGELVREAVEHFLKEIENGDRKD